jgi:nucleoside-diphosphate kinase
MAKFVVIAKPLGFNKVQIIAQFLKNLGVNVLVEKPMVCDSSRITRHYAQFLGKPFFQKMVEYYVGKDIVVFGCEAPEGVLQTIREKMGSAKPQTGSFRAELVGASWEANLAQFGALDNGIHCSDSLAEGKREWNVWFGVPPTSSRTENAHCQVWQMLSAIPNVDSLQYAGGEHEGTAVPNSQIDLDYRILVDDDNILSCNQYIQTVLGLNIDKVALDDESGATYFKYEIPIQGGKCDVAVVPTKHYRNQISKSHLIYLCEDILKQQYIAAKIATKGDKAKYKQTKKEWRLRLLQSINWQ